MPKQTKNEVYVVEAIVNKRFDNAGKIEYKIRWKGFPGEDTWEPLAHLDGCAAFIATFENHGYPVDQNVKVPAKKTKTAKTPKKGKQESKKLVGKASILKLFSKDERRRKVKDSPKDSPKRTPKFEPATQRKSSSPPAASTPPNPHVPVIIQPNLEISKPFEQGLVPDSILGLGKLPVSPGIRVLVKWRDTDTVNWVSATEAREFMPDMLFDYYEQRLMWSQ